MSRFPRMLLRHMRPYWQRAPGPSGIHFHPEAELKESWVKRVGTLLITVSIPVGLICYRQTHIETVPYTNRSRTMWLPRFCDKIIGDIVLRELLHDARESNAEAVLPPEHPSAQAVARVSERIVEAAGALGSGLEWEFHTIDAPEVANAMCLPNGKVVVYTGLFAITQDEPGLAVVLSHEISHAIARHSAEALGRQAINIGGMFMLHLAMGLQIYSLGTWCSSKDTEREADFIGLMLMSKACYDPNAAPRCVRVVWYNHPYTATSVLGDLCSGVTEANKYFSTHPPDEERAQNCLTWLPQAMELRKEHCPTKPNFMGVPLPGIFGRMLPGVRVNMAERHDM